ncbi:MAG: hypothetical protein E2600_13775 [Chryseobacterium sp.]|nr:hypothetical protein [Chryseobacterium sp.]
MKIKNIQQYRSIYKNEVRKVFDRDENFIGNFYFDNDSNKIKGWFDIYFGDTDGSSTAQNGVKNKLKSFLDMAKDGQAVYEFLQNAVDAGGTKFLMFYKQDQLTGEDYLLVINNGEMFSPASIRSILNIGSSTKANSSDKIGQFGIGFKLAHRLVGKDDALDELVNNLNGPILYSWKNSEILKFTDDIETVDLNYRVDKDENIIIEDDISWLFKILLTTFPCAINERPIVWGGDICENAPFSDHDFSILNSWLKEDEVSKYLKSNFEQGSLFLMKLGQGKLKELKEEPNLNLGVKFSLAVLKETSVSGKALHTAVINEQEVERPDLEFHKFEISKEKEDIDDYSYIRFGKTFIDLTDNELNSIRSEESVQVLFGFRKYNEVADYFKGSPSFYLYFPVSQEVHNFNFIIHSNALYKGASRVFLQSGGGVGLNERLFKIILKRLKLELTNLFVSEPEKFLNLFAALLTSGETNNNESVWITKCFTHPLDKLILEFVPVKNENGDIEIVDLTGEIQSSLIYILDSNIRLNFGYKYFYFESSSENNHIVENAVKKLSLKKFNLYHILDHENSYMKVNDWLQSSVERIQIFYKELTTKINYNAGLSQIQKENLSRIKWIVLSDNSIRSISDIGDNPFFLLNKNMFSAKAIFQKLGLIVSTMNLEEFIEKFNNNFRQTELTQFTHTVFTKLFSDNVQENLLNLLSNEERFELFEAFRENGDNSGERIRLLKLYRNRIGRYQTFGKMLNINGGLAGLLSIDESQLHKIQNTAILKNYLKQDPAYFYEKVYYPQWEDVLDYASINSLDITSIVGDLDYSFKHSNWEEKLNHPLSNSKVIIYRGKVISTNFYFIPTKDLEDFKYFQDKLEQFYKTLIPDEKYLSLFASSLPYGYNTELRDPELFLQNLTSDDMRIVLEISSELGIPFFAHNTIVAGNDLFETVSAYNHKQYYTDNKEIIDFVSNFADNQYKLLSSEFNSYFEMVQLKGNNLQTELCDFIINHKDIDFIATSAMSIIISADDRTKAAFMEKIDTITLGAISQSENERKIQFISSLQRAVEIEDLRFKILFAGREKKFMLGDLLPRNSSIKINHNNINFTDLFPETSDSDFEAIYQFYLEYILNKVDNVGFFNKLFKLESEQNIDELKKTFLKSLPDENEIRTIYQLYFLLFSGAFSEKEISDFFILNYDDDFVPLCETFYIFKESNIIAIKSYFIMNKCFNADDLLLKEICSKVYGSRTAIRSEFLLTKSTDYESLNSNITLHGKLDFLFESYRSTPVDQLFLNMEEIDSFLLITSEEKLISDLIDYGNAVLKSSISDWIYNDEDKYEFMKLLGFRFGDDLMSKLLNAVQSNAVDYTIFKNYKFDKKETELIFRYFLDNKISFSTANFSLVEFLCYFVREHGIVDQSRYVLIYKNRFDIGISLLDDASKFDYDVIDYVILTSSDEVIGKLFYNYKILYKNIAQYYECSEIEIKRSIVEDSVYELDDYFYNEWKRDVPNITLYRADRLEYQISVDFQDKTLILCNMKYDNMVWLTEDGNSLKLFYTSDKSLKYVVDLFSSSSYDGYNSYGLKSSLKKLEDCYNSINATISEALKSLDHEEVKEILQSQIEKEERRIEREEIILDIQGERKYSKEWFSQYLKYLNTVNEKSSGAEIKTLRFKEILTTGKSRFYKLSACSSMVPDNIDESRNISVKIYYGKNVKTFIIGSISQKNQVVLVKLEEDLPEELFSSFFMAEITYQPTVDLLQRLQTAYSSLDDWDDIFAEFPPIQYIYGPPGTGKTTTLKNKIKSLRESDPNVKILVLAPTNKACDVLAEKLYEDDFLDFVRLSSPTSELLDDQFYSNELTIHDLDVKNVLISTIHRHSYFKVNTDHSRFFLYNFDKWDYLIIDEASMINLPYMVFSSMITMQKSVGCELIIAGDPKQIPPVPELSDNEREEIEVQTENIYSMFGLSSFSDELQKDEIRDIDGVLNLTVQYRSIPEIGNLVSHFSYEKIVTNHRISSSRRELPSQIKKLLSSVVTFLNVPLEKDNQLFSVNKLIYSSYHLYSCIVVNEFIKFFDKHNKDPEKWTIGIISPYKAQSVLSNRLKADLKLNSNIKVVADTVHGFQGDECDIIFYLCNPSSYSSVPHRKSLLSYDFIYNVAISRAKDYLVIVNPFSKLPGNANLNRIMQIYADLTGVNVRFTDSSFFEKNIFDQINFIDENTFITNHDDVNVYSKDVYKYYVKKNTVSIDLQISEHD